MSTSTLVIIGAALVLLVLVLVLLARTGRKSSEGPADDGIAMVKPATELSPLHTDEPLPEPAAATSPAAGLATAELAPAPAPAPVAEPAGPADPLTRLKGLGPKAEAVLNGLGVTRYEQIAAWNDGDIARVDTQMGNFKGRIVRDRWVEQARLLSAGDIAGFEATFGKLG
jgi:predicted flap endonuclease-1-like 5' DNA nuclease